MSSFKHNHPTKLYAIKHRFQNYHLHHIDEHGLPFWRNNLFNKNILDKSFILSDNVVTLQDVVRSCDRLGFDFVEIVSVEG
jgi:hypothetical protein